MAYTPTVWANDSAPFLNATNLNKMETGIDQAHDSSNIAFVQSGTGAVATDVQTKLRETVSIKADFAAAADGVTDDSGETQAALTAYLTKIATDIQPTGKDDATGYGVVFVQKILDTAPDGGTPPPPPPPVSPRSPSSPLSIVSHPFGSPELV